MRDVIEELRKAATHSEAEYTANGDDWRAFDEMAVELEVAEFLYALVRLEKPRVVVESGSGKGYSTLAIGGALRQNGRGSLRSYEPEKEFRNIAQSRTESFSTVTIYEGSSLDHQGGADLVFLDSGPLTRWEEIGYWLDMRCTLVIHDAYRYDILKRRGGNMHHSPRGLWVRQNGARLNKWREQEDKDFNVGSRAVCRIVQRDGRSYVKKLFVDKEPGRIAFAAEKRAYQVFRKSPWFLPWLEYGGSWFVNSMQPQGLRLDKVAPTLSYDQRKDIAGQVLSIVLDMLVRGYSHCDLHAKNVFFVDGQLKLMDFECLTQYEGKRPGISGCYDVTGKGLDSPWAAENMCYTKKHQDSLSTVLGVDFQEAKSQLAFILKRELREASLTFKTRQGRHKCSQEKTYSAFSLPGFVIKPEDAQRDCAKRFERFGAADFLAGKSVLDLGSNVGGMMFEAQRFKPAECLGFEYDESKVNVASRVADFCGLENVKFRRNDIDTVIDDYKYDVVMCLALEAHVEDPKRLYRLLGKITREVLFFEGNATTDINAVEVQLLKNGFNRVEQLGVCDDDSRPENNCRPLLRAFKSSRLARI